jgi:hypothetical protein
MNYTTPGQLATFCTPTVVQCSSGDHGDMYVASDELNEKHMSWNNNTEML